MSTVAAAPRIYTAHRGGGPARGSHGVRLTRRGRATLLLLFLGVTLALLGVLGGHSAATDEPGRPVHTRTILVGEGDTLWDIASQIAAPGQTREMIRYIEDLNALSSPSLMQGQRLAIPVRSAGEPR